MSGRFEARGLLLDLKFPNLETGKILFQSGYRTIFEGVYVPEKRSVIIEVLDGRRDAPLIEVESLNHQAEQLKKIDHPNLPKVYGHGEVDGFHFLAQEKGSDVCLSDHMSNGMYLPPLEATRLVLDLASALKEVHRLGGVHGELRPSLILFDDNEQVMIRGAFQQRRDKEYLLDMFARRPHHLAPEIIRMEEPVIQSDHYALGIIYHELLTGTLPYEMEEVKGIWKFHLEGTPMSLPKELLAIEGLGQTLERMLAKRPKLRHASDVDLLAALEEIEDLLMMGEADATELYSSEPTVSSGLESKSFVKKVEIDQPAKGRNSKLSSKKKTDIAPKTPTPSPRRQSGPKKSKSAPRQWKVNERSASKKKGHSQKKASSSRRQKETPPWVMLSVSAGAILAIGILIYLMMSSTETLELKEQDKRSGPRIVIKSAKQFEAEKAGLLDENGALVDLDARSKMNQKMAPPVEKEMETVVVEPLTDQQKKIDQIKALALDSSEGTLRKLESFLDDEDLKVRWLANQVYRDVKGGVLMTEEDFARIEISESEMDMLANGDASSVLKYLEEMRNSSSSALAQILNLSTQHESKEVQFKALEIMKSKNLPDWWSQLMGKLTSDPSDVRWRELAKGVGPEKMKVIVDLARNPESRGVQFLWPLLASEGVVTDQIYGEVLKTQPEQVFPLSVALLNAVPKSQEMMLSFMESNPRSDAIFVLCSILREATLNSSHLDRLESLLPNLGRVAKSYLETVLASLGRTSSGFGDDRVKTVMITISDMGEGNEEQWKSLFGQLGNDDRADEDIIRALAGHPSVGLPYLKEVLDGKYPLELKFYVLDSLSSGAQASELLFEVMTKVVQRKELLEAARQKFLSMGDQSLIHLEKSQLTEKEKMSLALELSSPAALEMVVNLFINLPVSDAKKSLSMLFSALPKASDAVDALLTKHPDVDFVKTLLGSLKRTPDGVGLNGCTLLLNHDDQKLATAAFSALKQRLDGAQSHWLPVFSMAKLPAIRVETLDHLEKGNEHFLVIIDMALKGDDVDVRKAALDAMTREETYSITPFLVNQMIVESNSRVKQEVVKLLFTSLDEPHPVALVWGAVHLSGSLKKKLIKKLIEHGNNGEALASLSKTLTQPYHIELKMEVIKFLQTKDFNYFPSLFRSLNVSDPTSVEFFKEGVRLGQAQYVPDMLSKLNSEANVGVRKIIEECLRSMDVQYRLDPKTGKYIL